MGERPIGLGKVGKNGTLNENGAFYSVQDVNLLLGGLSDEVKGGNVSSLVKLDNQGVITEIDITAEQLKELSDSGVPIFFTITSGVYNVTYWLQYIFMYDTPTVGFQTSNDGIVFVESDGKLINNT